ncbi:MAG: family 78 glycoside hydrolase catalytic domain, partial [Luteolibacter sp.]
MPNNLSPMRTLLLTLALAASCGGAPVHLVDEKPVAIQRLDANTILVDFGRTAFGNIELIPPADAAKTVTVHFGEDLRKGRINRKPPGTVRYASTPVRLGGAERLIAAPPADARNTQTDRPDT